MQHFAGCVKVTCCFACVAPTAAAWCNWSQLVEQLGATRCDSRLNATPTAPRIICAPATGHWPR
eukprot:1140986-Pelagomonas_calceolata.AAC.2